MLTNNTTSASTEWRHFFGPQPYLPIVQAMQEHAIAIRRGQAGEAVWLLEHDAVYTGGTSARDDDLLAPGSTPTIIVGRGGQWTWHGPGQRVAYIMLDLSQRGQDVRAFVNKLESWVIASLADFGIDGMRRSSLPGIWVPSSVDGRLDKIAAIGIRISRWVSWHGISINHAPDLAAYDAIVPCGVTDGGVTSMRALGSTASMDDLDASLKNHFTAFFPEVGAT